MDELWQVLAIIAMGFLAWFLYRMIRHQPDAFRGQTLQSALSTLGLLALVLIGFVGLLVWMLQNPGSGG